MHSGPDVYVGYHRGVDFVARMHTCCMYVCMYIYIYIYIYTSHLESRHNVN